MSDLRFDNRVVVITGAARGIGRQYALYFAQKGAKVLANDSGVDLNGKNPSRIVDQVVDEIKKKGGIAVANYEDVINGAKIIEHAVKEFGKIDVLINNAGFLRDGIFAKQTQEDWNAIINAHLNGTYALCKAAWPLMRDQGYGRIINTSSGSGLYGQLAQTNYSAAKMGIVGLSLTLAREGERRNILVNVIVPVAGSRMTETIFPPDVIQGIAAENVVPIVALLAHESNKTTNGAIYECSAGFVARLRWQRSEGVLLDLPVKVEDVQKNWDKINSFEGKNTYPTNNADLLTKVNENLDRLEAQKAKL
ncbi:bifunctional hydroxyacyl-CoA dehydrogenase/enoyl-CoA hydratase fox2 [Paramecium bursaria]